MMDMFPSPINTLSVISRDITREHFLGGILDLIMTLATQVTPARHCTLWLNDSIQDPAVYSLRASRNIFTHLVTFKNLQPSQGIVGQVVVSGQPFTIRDVSAYPGYLEKTMAEQTGLISLASIPLPGNAPLPPGVLNCYTSMSHRFTASEISRLSEVAGQAAKVIESTEAIVRSIVANEELAYQTKLQQAVTVLMQRYSLDSERALSLLKTRSMEVPISLKQAAEAILLSA